MNPKKPPEERKKIDILAHLESAGNALFEESQKKQTDLQSKIEAFQHIQDTDSREFKIDTNKLIQPPSRPWTTGSLSGVKEPLPEISPPLQSLSHTPSIPAPALNILHIETQANTPPLNPLESGPSTPLRDRVLSNTNVSSSVPPKNGVLSDSEADPSTRLRGQVLSDSKTIPSTPLRDPASSSSNTVPELSRRVKTGEEAEKSYKDRQEKLKNIIDHPKGGTV